MGLERLYDFRDSALRTSFTFSQNHATHSPPKRLWTQKPHEQFFLAIFGFEVCRSISLRHYFPAPDLLSSSIRTLAIHGEHGERVSSRLLVHEALTAPFPLAQLLRRRRERG